MHTARATANWLTAKRSHRRAILAPARATYTSKIHPQPQGFFICHKNHTYIWNNVFITKQNVAYRTSWHPRMKRSMSSLLAAAIAIGISFSIQFCGLLVSCTACSPPQHGTTAWLKPTFASMRRSIQWHVATEHIRLSEFTINGTPRRDIQRTSPSHNTLVSLARSALWFSLDACMQHPAFAAICFRWWWCIELMPLELPRGVTMYMNLLYPAKACKWCEKSTISKSFWCKVMPDWSSPFLKPAPQPVLCVDRRTRHHLDFVGRSSQLHVKLLQ
jgi:hypothetical protein